MLRKMIALGQLLVFLTCTTNGQDKREITNEWKSIYRSSSTQINNLKHTKFEVRFDFTKSYLYGKAWLTLSPHFYNTDTLTLDAKGMNINKVAIAKSGKTLPLAYTYDSLLLRVKLDRVYSRNELYTIYIDYTAKPNEFAAVGSEAITDAKGLYFINPLGKDSSKPIEIWTQGETEASSVWFPTIDETNQKTTQEISMTVPDKFVTLSNGALITQKLNKNGTRTDTWKMDKPHSPYLFFMGVGDFAIIKDSYNGKEVSYYVEKPYAKVARKIFGLTPEMMRFFSKKLNYEYPWNKYAQMTGRDYVSGAMENTTATLHSDFLQQNERQLSDGNKYEDYISHELFHQWFGDLVTAESWSNLTLNESFANYGELLWLEHKYGKDAAEAHNYKDLQAYINRGNPTSELVRFKYKDKEDMFDLISYQKGGRILNMLRNYVGDEAFFSALNLYLKTYQFKNAEAHQLRLAFEEVTGEDLNWFWNQWYFGSGHPELNISYSYDANTKQANVFIKQMQEGNLFKLPLKIDIYTGNKKLSHKIITHAKADTLSFAVEAKPLLINVDADKVLLGVKKDSKSLYDYIFQYRNAKTYVDRREAVEYALNNMKQQQASAFVLEALDDKNELIRLFILTELVNIANDINQGFLSKIEAISKSDSKRLVRAAAIDVLAETKNNTFKPFYISGMYDSSYNVAGASLLALSRIDENQAISQLPQLKKDNRERLTDAIKFVEIFTKTDNDFDSLTNLFDGISMYEKFTEYNWYLAYLSKVNNTQNFKKGLDRIIAFRQVIGGFDKQYADRINMQLKDLIDKKLAIINDQNKSEIDEQVLFIQKSLQTN